MLLAALLLMPLWTTQVSVDAVSPQVVYNGLNFPVSLKFAPDGRIFFNEKNTGNIRIIQNGVIQPTPFATLTVSNTGEQGLLGIALDPHFASNGYIYVYYTYFDGCYLAFLE